MTLRRGTAEQSYALGAGQPFRDNQPYLGGWVRLLAGPIAANANLQVTHGLRAIPRFAQVIDSGTTGIASPLPRGASAWHQDAIYVNIPAVAAGQTVTLWIA